MSIDVRIKAYRPYDDLTIALAGELDLATEHQVSDAIEAFRADRFDQVTLDCADLTFCDCTGLDTLIAAHHNVADAGGQLHLTRPRPIVRQVIDITQCRWLLADPPISP